MPAVNPDDVRAWQRAAWAGMAVALVAFWLQSQMPKNGCGGDPSRDPLIAFQLARTPQDIATLFGMLFGGPCTAGLKVGFDYANKIDLFIFIPVYGFFLGQLAWLVGARGTHSSGAVLLGFCAAAIGADIFETLLQLHITSQLPGSLNATQLLGFFARAKYMGLAAYALMSAYLLWHQVVATPRWVAAWVGISGALTLLALIGLLPQDWLIACVGLGWIALLGLAMAQGFDKDLHKAP